MATGITRNFSLGFNGLGVVDPIKLTETAASLFKSVAGVTYTDGPFIKYRDKVYAQIFANFTQSVYDPILAKYKLAHKDIPERKIGQTYAAEFGRLHDAVTELLNKRKSGWGNAFNERSAQIAEQYIQTDPDRAYKGAPDEALAWALANPNAVAVGKQIENPPSNVATAAFNVKPTVTMLLITLGVLALGGITYLVTKKKDARLQADDNKRKKSGSLGGRKKTISKKHYVSKRLHIK